MIPFELTPEEWAWLAGKIAEEEAEDLTLPPVPLTPELEAQAAHYWSIIERHIRSGALLLEPVWTIGAGDTLQLWSISLVRPEPEEEQEL